MPLIRSQTLLAALSLVCIVLWISWTFKSLGIDTSVPSRSQFKPKGHAAKNQHLDTANGAQASLELDLHSTLCYYGVCDISPDAVLSYARVEIAVTENSSFQTPLLQDIKIALPAFADLDSTHAFRTPLSANQKAVVQVISPPPPVDASNMIFGVATNIDRLEDSLDQFAHWAAANGARIIALCPEKSKAEDVDRTMKKSHKLNLDLKIITNDMEFDDRYFHLSNLMYNHTTSSTEWVSFIDDDTFFTSMHKLQHMLSKYPSPSKHPYYVGTLSEDFHQMFKWGFMGYGGGGVFVSTALLHQLVPHLDECASIHVTGDSRLARCIFSHSLTKLSSERDLYQIDLWGDASGFYEALRPQPVSVHHWKSWHSYDMVNISKVSAVCGDACIFQKYRFADDWQLTNGFSLVKYSEGNERAGTDERMEKTWWDSVGGSLDMFLHSVAPLRSRDEHKIQYLLEGAVVEAGAVRQFYVRRTREGDDSPKIAIVEIVWRKGGAKMMDRSLGVAGHGHAHQDEE